MMKIFTRCRAPYPRVRFTAFAACCMAMSLAACSKDPVGQPLDPVPPVAKGNILFGAEPGTRTLLGADGRSVTWYYQDQINVYMKHGDADHVYSPYSIVEGSMHDEDRSAVFEGGLDWQAPGSPHTFYAYYFGGSSGLELDDQTGLLTFPGPMYQVQLENSGNHTGQINVMIAEPVTVTSPEEGAQTTPVNFTFKHLYPMLEFRVAAYDNPNLVIESITLESLMWNESPAWQWVTMDITLSPGDAGYMKFLQAGQAEPVTLSIIGDETRRMIPATDQENFRTDPTALSDAEEVAGKVFIGRMVIQPCDLSRDEWETQNDARHMKIVVKVKESGVPKEYTFRNAGIKFESGKVYVSTLVLNDAKRAADVEILTPGSLQDVITGLYGGKPVNLSELKIRGTLDQRDFEYMKSEMPSLTHLDIGEITIAAYDIYPANILPAAGLQNTGLKNIVMPRNMTGIGMGAFFSCKYMTSLDLPSGLTSIADAAFYDCTGLTGELILPAGLTYIGPTAFLACRNLTGTLTIPPSITSISDSAFQMCYGFTGDLIIPEGITSIGKYTFWADSGFTGAVIAASVTSIGESAFANCEFTSIHMKNPTPVEYTTDMLPPGLTVYVPTGSAGLYEAADGWKDNGHTFVEE